MENSYPWAEEAGCAVTVCDTEGTILYMNEKEGTRKMIYQTAWKECGEVRGLVEISMEIPAEMPHYIRK